MYNKIINSTYLSLITSITLLLSAGWETFESFDEYTVGAHHGVLVFSIVQLLKLMPDFVHGLRGIQEVKTSGPSVN